MRSSDNPRDELLDRAVGWFAEHGIGDTSMRTLAAELGTSGRMLHYHFGSRRDCSRRSSSGWNGASGPCSPAT